MFALADAVAFFGLDSVNMPMIATLISLLVLPLSSPGILWTIGLQSEGPKDAQRMRRLTPVTFDGGKVQGDDRTVTGRMEHTESIRQGRKGWMI